VLEEVGGTTGLDGFVSGTSLDEDSDGCEITAPLLSGNFHTVVQLGGFNLTVELKSFRDLTNGKVTELRKMVLVELKTVTSSNTSVGVLSSEVLATTDGSEGELGLLGNRAETRKSLS